MGKNNRERRFQKQRKKAKQKSKFESIPPRKVTGQSFDEELKAWYSKKTNATAIKNGDDLEEISEKICRRIGVPDLICRSPMYVDGKGISKELCDFLILFGDTVVVFQVKHKMLNPTKDAEVIIQRARGLIDDAQSQFYTFLKFKNKNSNYRAKNISGFDIDFDFSKISQFFFVIVVAYPGSHAFPDDKKIDLVNGISSFVTPWDSQHPVHIFEVDDFEKVILELDTIPDFLTYLRKRDVVFNQHNIGFMNELDFLAFYKTKPIDLNDAIEQGALISLHPGIWETYTAQHAKQIVERNLENEVSYLVDSIIDKAKTSIGNIEVEARQFLSADPASIEASIKISTILSSYTRLQRRLIGGSIRDCILRADRNLRDKNFGFAHRFVGIKELPDQGVIILSVVPGTMTREERINFLQNLCEAAYVKFGLKQLIGIATESAQTIGRSEDYYLLEDVIFDGEALIKARDLAEKILGGKLNRARVTEYN